MASAKDINNLNLVFFFVNNLTSLALDRKPSSIKTDGISVDFNTAKPACLCGLLKSL